MIKPIEVASGESVTRGERRFFRQVTPTGQVPRDVCIHEAGHALASWWTGKGIARVTVHPVGEEGLNFTECEHSYIEGSDAAAVAAFCKSITRKQLNDRVLRELVQCMAGPMAEAKLKGYGFSWQAMAMDPGYRKWTEGDPPSDLHAWTALAQLPKPKDRQRVANGSAPICANMLAFYWPQVEASAEALRARHSMTGAELLAVIGEAPKEPLCALRLGTAVLES